MAPGSLARATDAFKVLGHPTRLRILGMLRSGGLCVCQVAAALAAPSSTVSEHLGELRRAGLVVEQREGRWVTYRLAEGPAPRALLDEVFGLIGKDPVVQKDDRLVRRLRRLPVEDLCDAGLDLARFGMAAAGAS